MTKSRITGIRLACFNNTTDKSLMMLKHIIAFIVGICVFLNGCQIISANPTDSSGNSSDISSDSSEITHHPGNTEAPDPDPFPPFRPNPRPEPEPEPIPTPDPTPEPSPEDIWIGSLYKRSQLLAISNARYACGYSAQLGENNRPINAVARQEAYLKYNAHFIGNDDNTFYLTFDCGYEHENLTAQILDILKGKGVPCIFFVDIHFARSCPGLIQRIVNEGHILGNHGSQHVDMTTTSVEVMASNISELHNYVLEHYGYTMNYFRPPSGYFSERVLAVAQSLGYCTVNYDFAYVDWVTSNQPDAQWALDYLLKCAHSGGIFLLHAVSSTNAQILPEFIDTMRQNGFTFALYTP